MFKVTAFGMFIFILSCNPASVDKSHQDIVIEYIKGKNTSEFSDISAYLHDSIVKLEGDIIISKSKAELQTIFQWDSVFSPKYAILDIEENDGAVLAIISKECQRIRFLHDSAIVYKNLYEFKDEQISKISSVENLVFDLY